MTPPEAIHLDPLLSNLIPPLTDEEYQQLEANLLAEGCRDALVVWPCNNHVILIDGHHRYRICHQHNLPFKTIEHDFTDRESASEWIIYNQLGRRNLAAFLRCELILKLEPLLAAKAKKNLVTSTGGQHPQPLHNCVKAVKMDTQKELAQKTNISHGTIYRAKVIAGKATEDVKEKLRKGEVSTNEIYKNICDYRKFKESRIAGDRAPPTARHRRGRIERPGPPSG